MTYLRARIGILLLSISGLVIALELGGAAWHPVANNIGDAGQLMTWTNQILALVNVLIGLRVVGLLVVYGFIAPSSGNSLDRERRRIVISAAKYSLLWASISFCAAVTMMATILGTTFSQALAPGTIPTYIWDLPASRSLLVVSILALLIAAIATVTTSLNSMALLTGLAVVAVSYPLLNSHAPSLGNHSLAITSSVVHSASMSLWVGALIAMWPFIQQRRTDVVARFSVLATWSVIALAISGLLAAATRMESITDIYQNSYGFLVLCKVLLFSFIAYCAINVRKSLAQSGQTSVFIIWELLTMAFAIGVGVALHFTTPSKSAIGSANPGTDILGFPMPPKPSFMNYFFGWHPEWFMLVVSLVAASLYTIGFVRLKRNKQKFSNLRAVSFYIGISLIIWVTCAGISKYAVVSFSAHMVQHMTLSMLAPIFIIMSAPITLALRALPTSQDKTHRNARGWILGLLKSRYTRTVTNPFIILFLFTVGLYGIYFTSIFATLMSSHSGHILMEIHFLITGLLFAFVVIGVDPAPHKAPYWGKLILVLVALSVHAFFAIAIMQSSTPIGSEWYSRVQPPWITDALQDTYMAGGIAWALGEVPTLLLLVIVAVQWAKSDTRLAKQRDRAADRDGNTELSAYNEELARLNQQSVD